MGPLKCFTISRKRWIHTPEDLVHKSLLLRRSDNKMCCLGFAGKACGLQDFDILEKVKYIIPPHIPYECPLPKDLSWLADREIPFGETNQERLIKINDSMTIPDEEKERLIAFIFAEHGIEVTFAD